MRDVLLMRSTSALALLAAVSVFSINPSIAKAADTIITPGTFVQSQAAGTSHAYNSASNYLYNSVAGQTFSAYGSNLKSFTFNFSTSSNVMQNMSYHGLIYSWDSTTGHISSSTPVFDSGPIPGPVSGDYNNFQNYTVNTNGLSLNPGAMYMALIMPENSSRNVIDSPNYQYYNEYFVNGRAASDPVWYTCDYSYDYMCTTHTVGYSTPASYIGYGVGDFSDPTGLSWNPLSIGEYTGYTGTYYRTSLDYSMVYGSSTADINSPQTPSLASNLGTSLNPRFNGGILLFDYSGTFNNNFAVVGGTNNILNSGNFLATLTGSIDNEAVGQSGTITFNSASSDGSFVLGGTIGNIENVFGSIINNTKFTVNGNGSIYSSGITNNGSLIIAQGGQINDDLDNNGYVENNGIYTANVNNNTSESVINNTSTGVWNGNLLTNSGQVSNAGTWNGYAINDNGILNNTGTWVGNISNGHMGTLHSSNVIDGNVNNQNTFHGSGSVTGNVNNSGNAQLYVDSDLTVGSLGNNDQSSIIVDNGNLTVNGSLNNYATSSFSSPIIIYSGRTLQADTVYNSSVSTIRNDGTLTSVSNPIKNDGSISNNSTGTINGGVVNNAGANLDNSGTINGGVTNAGNLTSTGTINGGVTNSSSALLFGVTNGGLVNKDSGTVNIYNNVFGGITNQDSGTIYLYSDAVTDSTVTNTGTAYLALISGLTGVTDLSNSSTNGVGIGNILTANNIFNYDRAKINNSGTTTVSNLFSNAGIFNNNNNGTLNGNITNTSTGSINNAYNATINGNIINSGYLENYYGTINGAIDNNSGYAVNSGVINGNINNSGVGTFYLNDGSGTGTITNSDTAYLYIGSHVVWTGDVTSNSSRIVNDGTVNGALNNITNGTVTNNKAWNGDAVSSGTITNQSIWTGNANNYSGGTISNFVTWNGNITNKDNSYLYNYGTISGDVISSGYFYAYNQITGNVTNQGDGAFQLLYNMDVGGNFTTSDNSTTNIENGNLFVTGDFVNNSTNVNALNIVNGYKLTAANVTNGVGAYIINNGQLITNGVVTNNGNIQNNNLLYANVVNTSTGNLNNNATVTGTVNNAGYILNNGYLNSGVNNSGRVDNNATIYNQVVNSGTFNNYGIISGSVENTGTFRSGVNEAGDFVSTSAISGSVTNSGNGIFNVGGAIQGSITNSENAILNVFNGLSTGDVITISDNSTVNVVSGVLEAPRIVNNSTRTYGITVGFDSFLRAQSITNGVGASIEIDGQITNDNKIDNYGTIYNFGYITGGVTNYAGSNLMNNATINGGVINNGTISAFGTINGGIVNNSTGYVYTYGTVNGGLTNNANAHVYARGTINGAISNSGIFQINSSLSGNGSAFTNSAGSTLFLGNTAMSGFGAVTNASGATIYIGAAYSDSRDGLSSGVAHTLAPVYYNGSLNAASINNSGSIVMANNKVGDSINLTGAYNGVAGSTISMDVNLTTRGTDILNAATTSGTTAISLNNLGTTRGYLTSPIILVHSTGGNGVFTAANDASTNAALASTSVLDYRLAKINGTSDWGIVSTFKSNLVSSMGTAISALSTSTQNSGLFFANTEEVGFDKLERFSWKFGAKVINGQDKYTVGVSDNSNYTASANVKSELDYTGYQLSAQSRYKINDKYSLDLGVVGGDITSTVKEVDSNLKTKVSMPNYGITSVLNSAKFTLDASYFHASGNITPDRAISTNDVGFDGDIFTLGASVPLAFKALADNNVNASAFVKGLSSTYKINGSTIGDNSGTLSLKNIESQSVTAGFKISKDVRFGSSLLKPYAELSVTKDSADNAATTFHSMDGSTNIEVANTRADSWSNVKLGVEGEVAGTQVSIGAGYSKGSDFDGVSAKIGIRRNF